MNAPSRLEIMRRFVATRPNDAFARYGLAMEQMKLGLHEDAAASFETLLDAHPHYIAAYYQAVRALVAAGRRDDATAMVARGIAACDTQGDLHARDEILSLAAAEGI